MSDINYHSSNTSSYLNWPFDHQIKVRQQHDGVSFQNVANQYVKGEEITAFFTISRDTKVNPDGDQIGLIRVYKFYLKFFYIFAFIDWLYKYKKMFVI